MLPILILVFTGADLSSMSNSIQIAARNMIKIRKVKTLVVYT